MDYNEIMQRISQFPKGLKPLYQQSKANKPIRLYKGKMIVNSGTGSVANPGLLQLKWLPTPILEFKINVTIPLQLASVAIKLHGYQESEGYITNMNVSRTMTNSGRVYKVNYQKKNEIQKVIFHLPNFKDFLGEQIRITTRTSHILSRGRLTFESNSWTVVVDHTANTKEVVEQLKSNGGYGLTHTGLFERVDGTSFNRDTARDMMQAFFHFFSFLRGFWSGPLLLAGFNNNKKVWCHWEAGKLPRWTSIWYWFPFNELNTPDRTKVFLGFMSKWEDPLWNESIRVAIHWYITANLGIGGVEASIVLLQNAFELISWMFFVVDSKTKTMTPKQFKDKSFYAEEKIRRLLTQLRLPTSIPRAYNDLRSIAQGNADGPQVFTWLRNRIVHPGDLQKLLSLPVDAIVQASQLGLWWLETILLRLFDYQYQYLDRRDPDNPLQVLN